MVFLTRGNGLGKQNESDVLRRSLSNFCHLQQFLPKLPNLAIFFTWNAKFGKFKNKFICRECGGTFHHRQ